MQYINIDSILFKTVDTDGLEVTYNRNDLKAEIESLSFDENKYEGYEDRLSQITSLHAEGQKVLIPSI